VTLLVVDDGQGVQRKLTDTIDQDTRIALSLLSG
jgi:hypothetical protein